MTSNNIQVAILGGGCFWCTEAVFQKVRGIEKVVSGYTDGKAPGRPTYREVCSGLSGFAEVVRITYDANVVSYEDILMIFMTTHDPTSLNKQGADRGTQYRSAIYYFDEKQKNIAEMVLKELAQYYENPIVTQLSEAQIFYEAEKEHQDFYKNNPDYGYCSFVIDPKLAKLRKLHADKLK